MDQDNIVKNLRALFGREWNWQPKKLDEFSFQVRFPLQKKVESFVINKLSYFYLQNGAVMASLKVWNGNIERIGYLSEVWV